MGGRPGDCVELCLGIRLDGVEVFCYNCRYEQRGIFMFSPVAWPLAIDYIKLLTRRKGWHIIYPLYVEKVRE
jgi:hypothetical protein